MHQIVILGDRQSIEEFDSHSGPFSGRYAQWFRKELARNGLSPIFINAWAGKRIENMSLGHQATLLANVKRYDPRLVLALGLDVSKLLGLTDLVTADKDQWENLVNFICTRHGLTWMPLFHPREVMKQDHWGYFIKAGLRRAKELLDQPAITLDKFGLKVTLTPTEIMEHLSACQASTKPFCLDIETRYERRRENGKVVSTDNSLKSIAWAIDIQNVASCSIDQHDPEFFPRVLSKIKLIMEDPNRMKVGQNIFFDSWCLWHYHGIKIRGPVFDTLHVSNILRDFLPKSLNWLAKLYLVIEPWKGGHRFTGEQLRLYNAQDVAYTLHIMQKMHNELHKRGLYRYWAKYRKNLFEATFDMATKGLIVDVEHRAELKEKALEELASIQSDLDALCAGHIPPKEVKRQARDEAKDVLIKNLSHKFTWVKSNKKKGIEPTKQEDFDAFLFSNGISADAAKDLYFVKKDKPELGFKTGEVRRKAHQAQVTLEARTSFNPRSNPQKQAVLKNLGIVLEKTKKTEDKDTTSSGAIRKTLSLQAEKLSDTQKQFLLNLIRFSDYSKMVSTYYDMKLMDGNRWLYSYNIEGAETGRSSSSKTPIDTGGNSQNLPRAGKAGINFKTLILPSPGKILVSRDQKSAESVVVAYLAGCGAMIEEFNKDDPDFHTLVARMLHPLVTGRQFDDEPKELKKGIRQSYKAVSHGGSYGLYEHMLQELLFAASGNYLPASECKMLLDGWHAALPEIKSVWHQKTLNRLNTGEAWRNVFGREHTHGGIKSYNSLNEMLAWEPQSTVPELTNIMLKWSYDLAHVAPEMGLQVLQHGHDALLSEIKQEYLVDYIELFDKKSNSIKLAFDSGTTVIKWDCQVGQNWGSLVNYKKENFE